MVAEKPSDRVLEVVMPADLIPEGGDLFLGFGAVHGQVCRAITRILLFDAR